jgi:hypothetical protein
MKRIVILMAAVLTSVSGADVCSVTAMSWSNVEEEQSLPKNAELAFSIAFGLPYVAAVSVSQSREMVVEAVYQATALSGAGRFGRIASTGTIEVRGDDARYVPTPRNRLVVKLEGYTHEFTIKEAQGNNMASTSTQWLLEPHILRYVHKIPGMSEAEISERFDGTRFTATVKGWYKYKDERFDLNLSSSGGASGERDYHGQDTQVKYNIKGRVHGAGMEVLVDERHAEKTVSATNLRLLYSMRGSASRFNATINNVLRFEGKEYKLENVKVQTESKTKGGVSSFAVTGFEGKVLQDGEPFGECVMHMEEGVLKTSSGAIALKLPVPDRKPQGKEKE